MSCMFFGRLPAAGLIVSVALACFADDYVVTDFESGQLNTPLNGYWYVFTDRNSATPVDTVFGNSVLTSFDEGGFPFYDSLGNPDPRTFPAGHGDGSTRALRFAYQLGDRRLSCGESCTYAPYVGFGLGFSTLADTVDLTGAAGIAFWAKAEKAPLVLNVSVGTRDTSTTAPDYSQRFVLDTAWKRCTIELKASEAFKQPAYGPRKPFNPTVVKSMNFGVNRGENDSLPENALHLDDLVILAWSWVDPTAIPRRPARAGSAPKLALSWAGSLVRIRLPEAWAGKPGQVQAVDAAGRILGRAAFGPAMHEVALDVGRTARQGVRFRILP